MEIREKLNRTLAHDGVMVVGLKALRYPFKPLLVPRASASLRRQARGVETIPHALTFVRTFKSGGMTISPWQVDSEITQFLETIEAERPSVVLDVGTANGGLLFLFAAVAAPDATLISVDLPQGQFGGGYASYRTPLYRAFARGSQKIELVRADSHEPSTLATIQRHLAGREVDLLFIDGDHSYDGVKQDYETFSPLVRDGGIIGFHDIIPGEPEYVGGVPTFWQELKAEEASARELVDDWNRGSCGIGMLRKRAAEPARAAS